ncbi:hypothetical protein EsH8_VI_001263 [Colletotrichum jinshuiense]
MQDSVEDWQTQASLMYEVYRNALICISALGAADDATGCFFNRNIENVKPSVVTLSLDGTIPAKSYLNDKEIYRWQDRFASEPLARRAWVVQERLLAPRTLHFGSSQIYWECHEEICCETDPDYDWWKVAHYGDSSKIRSSWKSLIGMKRLYAKDPVFALTEDWGNIARVYGGCQLTNSRDKLVAISAIAKDMKQRLQSLGEPARYLAGIWGQWLPRSLLWFIIPTTAGDERPRPYRAPSWSWASVDGDVRTGETSHWDNLTMLLSSVSDAEVAPLTKDDTGQVHGGTVTLNGKLVVAKLSNCTNGPWEAESGGVVNLCQVDGFKTTEGTTIECDVRPADDIRQNCYYGSVLFDTEEDMCRDVLFLPISVSLFKGPDYQYSGLLLSKAEHGYRRLGLMNVGMAGEQERGAWLDEITEREVRIE